jgi:hypothetical protein
MNGVTIAVPAVTFVAFVVQTVWYVAVTVMLFKIWRKVKHLLG